MADHDVIASPSPQLPYNPNYSRATVAELKALLVADDATYYTTARLNEMTYNDLVYAVRLI